MNQRWRLVRVPGPALAATDFELVDEAVRPAGDGEVRLRSIYLSLDPYQRHWLGGAPGYGAPPRPGDTPIGRAISEVLESRDPRFAAGDVVLGETGWQSQPTVAGERLTRLDPTQGPLSTYVGVLGSPGLTAWVGMLDLCKPRVGDVVLVSAAGGAVGSVAGQLAAMQGARVIGVAGAPDKCARIVRDFGFAACLSHRAPDFVAQLAHTCPDGIDAYFDNTGGAVTAAAWERLRHGARIALCGLVAEYGRPDVPGPPLRHLLAHRASVTAFSVREHLARMNEYRQQASAWIREGRLRYAEHVVQGIEQTPAAFLALLSGATFGKCLVQIGAAPRVRAP
ncbi:MAG: NADP-dependent oxidoreductase [Burkholderiales bacterium]|nr:NADP-dependent oxidoreductase [Burkholderiales bacterium]